MSPTSALFRPIIRTPSKSPALYPLSKMNTFSQNNLLRRVGSAAVVCIAALAACVPYNPLGKPLNPNGPHRLRYAKVMASGPATSGLAAEWSDSDDTGPTPPNLSLCKLTLQKGQTYGICIDRATLAQAVALYRDDIDDGLHAGDTYDPSSNYVSLMARNPNNYKVFLSDPSHLLDSAIYTDDNLFFTGAFQQGSKTGVGRNQQWKTANVAQSGTITLTIVRGASGSVGANDAEAIPSLPSPAPGIIDLVMPIQVTVQ